MKAGPASSPQNDPPRYAPELPFPPYTYVPGAAPHPVSDPAGHAYGKEHRPPAPIVPDEWRDSREYLFAFDLFNHGYYWEAHEVWESLWLSLGREGPVAEMLKGLIKLAAAGVKLREGRGAGVQRHADRALALFDMTQSAVGGDAFLGLSFASLQAICDRVAAAAPAPVDAEPRTVLPQLVLEGMDS